MTFKVSFVHEIPCFLKGRGDVPLWDTGGFQGIVSGVSFWATNSIPDMRSSGQWSGIYIQVHLIEGGGVFSRRDFREWMSM